MFHSKPTAAIAVILDDEGRMLAATRKHPSLYAFPGGHIDPGETPYEAMVREVREETGIVVEEARKVFEDANHGVRGARVVTAFLVTKWSGTPRKREAGVDVLWASPSLFLDPEHSPYRRYAKKLFQALGLGS
jgi:8-oxo-dGTP diphosphatase